VVPSYTVRKDRAGRADAPAGGTRRGLAPGRQAAGMPLALPGRPMNGNGWQSGSSRRWLAPVAGVGAAALPLAVALSWTPGVAAGGTGDAVPVATVAAGGPAAWAFRGDDGEEEPRSRSAAAEPAPLLRIPVLGLSPGDLRDSFGHARGEARPHGGIDIFAPTGTGVVAVADGWVVRLTWNRLGGQTLYLLDAGGGRLYYYAHLEAYAADLEEGQFVREGETVGYVGRTGNTVGGAHLHFEVLDVRTPERWWEGRRVNPHPLLTGR
jgi:peptidoglycan LD-endopeptidase LytH